MAITKMDHRIVLFVDFVIKSETKKYKGLAPLPAKKIIKILSSLSKSGNATWTNSAKTESFYISDFHIKANKATLLINKSDRKIADPTFSDPQKKSRRVVNKKQGEGQDFSSHIIWDLTEENPNQYPVLIEMAPGLPSSKIRSVLNQILKKHVKENEEEFLIDNPDGSKNKILPTPKIEAHGHLCEEFKQELSNGKIDGVEIYTETERNDPFDSKGYSTIREKSIKVGLRKNKLLPENVNLLKAIFKESKSKNLELARVKFTTEDGINRTLKLQTETMSVANDSKFIKKRNLQDFNNDLKSSYETINKEIESKMKELLD